MVKIGRNDSCPCGSGKKYKKCCYLDSAKNERIISAAGRLNTWDELTTFLNQPVKICRLRVKLDSIASEEMIDIVSRTIEIEDEDTLYALHLEIQHAFGWDNDHLYSFYMSNKLRDIKSEYAGDPAGDDLEASTFGDSPESAAQTELRFLRLRKRKKFKYRFDYGDELIHTVEVLDIFERGDRKESYPRTVDKIGCPPSQYVYEED